ncbi:MAG: hypothetical protein WCK39_11295 [Methanomassiliicoccales archaeon]
MKEERKIEAGETHARTPLVKRFENPPDRGYNRPTIIIGFCVFVFAIFIALTAESSSTKLTILLIGILGGCGLPFGVWLREKYWRPSVVEIRHNGIVFEWRHHKPMQVKWEDVVGVSICRDQDYFNHSSKGIGGIILRKGMTRFTTVEICDEIVVAYRENKGKDIPQIQPGVDIRTFRRMYSESE